MSVTSRAARLPAAVIAVLALSLTACSGDTTDEETPTPAEPSASAPESPTDELTSDDALLSPAWTFEPGDGLQLGKILSTEDDEWILLVADETEAFAVVLDPADGTEIDRQPLPDLVLHDDCAVGPTTLLCADHQDDTFQVIDRSTFRTTATVPGAHLMALTPANDPGLDPEREPGGWFFTDGSLTMIDTSGEVTATWAGVEMAATMQPLIPWNGDYYLGRHVLPAGGGAAPVSETPVPESVVSPTRAISRTVDQTGWVLLDENLAVLGTVEGADTSRFSPIDPGEDCAFLDRSASSGGASQEVYLLDRDTFAKTSLSEPLDLGRSGSAECHEGTIFAALEPVDAYQSALYSITADGSVTLVSEEIREIVNRLSDDLVLAEGNGRAYVFDLTTGEILEEVEDLDLSTNIVPTLIDVAPLFVQATRDGLEVYRTSAP